LASQPGSRIRQAAPRSDGATGAIQGPRCRAGRLPLIAEGEQQGEGSQPPGESLTEFARGSGVAVMAARTSRGEVGDKL
jgi:hypothetical protein